MAILQAVGSADQGWAMPGGQRGRRNVPMFIERINLAKTIAEKDIRIVFNNVFLENWC
jgi:hypothetical protein